MSHPLYRIGEFARLCGIGKDTLFHYDKIGLLRPALVADNGYRYYTLQQYYQFHIISVLKQAGMPLREIKAYLAEPDRHAFLTMLRGKTSPVGRRSPPAKANAGSVGKHRSPDGARLPRPDRSDSDSGL